MPPQSSPKFKQQATQFLKAFKKLCALISNVNPRAVGERNSIDKQRNRLRHNEIKVDSDTLNTLRQILRDHRSNGKTIEEDFSSKVVACFDGIEGDICERLEPQVFRIFLEILLQADYTHYSERGLYLLGASLYNNNTKPDIKRGSFDKKKSEYLKLCHAWLLSDFVDTQRPAGLRRCVGVLCIQLLANAEAIGSSLDDRVEIKQKLGLLITGETDEFIRVIAGQIIRAMLEKNARLREFWPADESKMIRDQFPQAPQGETGWTQRFSKYLDDLWPTLKDRPVLNGNLCFAQKVEISPQLGFEDHDHTVYVFVEKGMFRMMTLASPDSFDQWIELPIGCIEEMCIVNRDDSSQISASAEVFFNLSLSDEYLCYLNSRSVRLKQVHIAAFFDTITELKEALKSFSKDMKVKEERCLLRSVGEQNIQIRTSSQVSESDAVVAWTNQGARVVAKKQYNEGQREGPDGSIAGEDIPASEHTRAMFSGADVFGTQQQQRLNDLDGLNTLSNTPTRKMKMPPPKLSYSAKNSMTQQRTVRVNRVRPVAKKPLQLGQTKSVGSLESAKSRDNHTAHDKSSPGGNAHNSELKPSDPKVRRDKTKRPTYKRAQKNVFTESVAQPKDTQAGGEYEIIPSPQPRNQAKSNEGKATTKKKAPKTPAALAIKAQGLAQSQFPTKNPESAAPEQAKRYSLKERRCVIDPITPHTAPKKANRRTAAIDKSEELSNHEYRPTTSATSKKLNKTTKLPTALAKSNLTAISSPFWPKAHPASRALRSVENADGRSGDLLMESSDTSELDPLHGRAVPLELNGDQISRPQQTFKQNSETDELPSSAESRQRIYDARRVNLPMNLPNTGGRMAEALDDMLAHLSTETVSPILAPASVVRRSMKTDCAESVGNATSLSIGKQAVPESPHFVLSSEQVAAGLGPTQLHMPKTTSLPSAPRLGLSMHDNSCSKMVAVASEVLSAPRTPIRLDAESPATAVASWTEQRSEPRADTKKRKSSEKEPSVAKKRRASVSKTTIAQSPLRRSPRIQAMVERQILQRKNHWLGKTQNQLERQSSEISPGAHAASIVLNLSAETKFLVDDHIIRKPQVISFNARGAQNQGPSESSKVKAEFTRETTTSLQPKPTNAQELKRKRDERRLIDLVAGKLDDDSRLKKRRSISPQEINIATIQDVNLGNDNKATDSQNAWQEVINHTPSTNKERMNANAATITRPPRLMRTELKNSSQNSRVAYNGSPIPFKAVDHFSRLYQKMVYNDPDSLDAFGSLAVKTDPAPFGCLRSPIILRSKLILGSSAKARPSLPDENRTRYVAHERTGNGSYKGMKTKEVVMQEEELSDPFLEAIERRSSGFADRLRNGSRSVVENRSMEHDLSKSDRAVLHKNRKVVSPSHQTTTSHTPLDRSKDLQNAGGRDKAENELPKHIAWAPLDEFDATFVDAGNQAENSGKLALGRTSNSSCTSSDEDPRRLPLEEKASLWNAALKPHYQKFSDAVHRVADEMIIRLSTEEDVMGLMVTQYQSNGTKILDQLASKRDVEKRNKLLYLEHRKEDMAGMCHAAKSLVVDTVTELSANSIAIFERDWHKEQQEIQRSIADGRAGA